jgi:hypothetical protein
MQAQVKESTFTRQEACLSQALCSAAVIYAQYIRVFERKESLFNECQLSNPDGEKDDDIKFLLYLVITLHYEDTPHIQL